MSSKIASMYTFSTTHSYKPESSIAEIIKLPSSLKVSVDPMSNLGPTVPKII